MLNMDSISSKELLLGVHTKYVMYLIATPILYGFNMAWPQGFKGGLGGGGLEGLEKKTT